MPQRIAPVLAAALALGAAPAVAVEPAPLRIAVSDGRVSAELEDASLADVLARLAEQADLQARVAPEAGARTLSASFDALPLEQALARLLRGTSHVLVRDPAGEGWRLWVLASGAAAAPPAARRPSARQAASTQALPEADRLVFDLRHAPDPEQRAAALVALSVAYPTQFVAVLADAFSDPDLAVRETALDLVASAPEDDVVPRASKLALLEQVSRTDAAPQMRGEALSLLAALDEGRAREAAMRMRDDPDEALREEAQALLESLGGGAGRSQ